MTTPVERLEAGYLIGSVYRFQVTRIPGALGRRAVSDGRGD